MWKERKSWDVSWSGTTIWGNGYNDSASFDDEQSAREFCTKLSQKNDVDYIHFKESTIWRKKK